MGQLVIARKIQWVQIVLLIDKHLFFKLILRLKEKNSHFMLDNIVEGELRMRS